MDPQHRWPPDRAGELAELFVECADTLVAGFDLVEFLIRLCDSCAGLLEIDAAGLVLADPQDRLQVMAASSEPVRQLELLQIESAQGPCLDCHRAGTPVVIPDLAEDGDRWPRFTPAAREAGFAAVHALPMRYHDRVIGAMNLYARTPGALDPDSVRIARALTDVATIGLLQHRERTDQATLIDQLHTAVTSRVIIEQANGMLAERFGPPRTRRSGCCDATPVTTTAGSPNSPVPWSPGMRTCPGPGTAPADRERSPGFPLHRIDDSGWQEAARMGVSGSRRRRWGADGRPPGRGPSRVMAPGFGLRRMRPRQVSDDCHMSGSAVILTLLTCPGGDEGGPSVTADRLVQACVDALEVDGAALTALGHRGEFVHLAAVGPAARIAELQLTTGTGPCWDAGTTHRSAHGTDLSRPAAQARWPGFAAAAVEQGVRAVFAFPLLAGAVCCGSLLLCRHRPGPLTAGQLRGGLGFAEAALWTLLDLRAGIPTDRPASPLGAGQAQVFQASGMIAAQLGTGVDDALLRLRAHAWAADRSLSETAADVVARRLRFDPAPS